MKAVIEVEIEVDRATKGYDIEVFSKEKDLLFKPSKGESLMLKLYDYPEYGKFEVKDVTWYEEENTHVIKCSLDPFWDRVTEENFDLTVWTKGNHDQLWNNSRG